MNHQGNSSAPAEEFRSFVRLSLKEHDSSSSAFELQDVPADGSRRRFWRILPRASGRTFIAVMNEPVDASAGRENLAYLMIGRHLHTRGLPVPRIHASHVEKGWFLVEDFGSLNLQDAASSHKDHPVLYERAVEVLFRLQIDGAAQFNPSWTCQTERYDETVMRLYESNYFKEAFLHGYLGMKREWPELDSPFNHLARNASLSGARFFLHRDFQSRNIMVMGRKTGVLDWQGGRLGPLGYDLASLLIDPYTALAEEEKGLIYKRYLTLLAERLPEEVDAFCASYPYLAIQRNLQILGAFSFLSRVGNKKHFEKYIPPALASLDALLLDLEDKELSALTELVTPLHHEIAEAHN